MSNELQVRLDWGDINTTAPFVRDESWSVSVNFRSNTTNLLTVTFADRNGGITLGTYENTFRTGTGISQMVQITADQFNTDRWDDDNDGVSNLDELIAGTNPVGGGAPMPVQASLELVPDKTFRITWQASSNAAFYKVMENPDGVSGFSDISGQLSASTSSFDHRVALYERVNAQYLVQSCNALGCVDSTPVFVTGTLVNAIGYFKASNTNTADEFGMAVSLSADGNTLAVGAQSEDSAAIGINGDENDNSVEDSGAVYLFARNDGQWLQQAYLKANDSQERDNFGGAVSLSADGNTLAVGAKDKDSATAAGGDDDASGAVYVFIRSDEVWQQQAFLRASNSDPFDFFGEVVNLSADGNTLAVGVPQEQSASTGINGDQNADFAFASGAVYVFGRSDETWQQQAYIKASNSGNVDGFGSSVSLNADGDTLAVGAWTESSAATGVNGDQSDNSAFGAGAVYVFNRIGQLWQQQAYIKASNAEASDFFGEVVSLSADGKTLAVGLREDNAATGINGNQVGNAAVNSGAVFLY